MRFKKIDERSGLTIDHLRFIRQ